MSDDTKKEGLLDMLNKENYQDLKTNLEKKVAASITNRIEIKKQDILDKARGQ